MVNDAQYKIIAKHYSKMSTAPWIILSSFFSETIIRFMYVFFATSYDTIEISGTLKCL